MSERMPNMEGANVGSPGVESEFREEQAKIERESEERSAEEFLLDFQKLKVDISQEASSAISSFEQKMADGKNVLSTPKNNFLKWRAERAEKKYDRVSAKMDTSHFNFLNKRYKKRADIASGMLQLKTEAYNDHSDMMQKRVEGAQDNKMERQNNIAEKRKELHEKRMDAIERRIVRHERYKERRKLESKYSRFEHQECNEAVEKFLDQPAFKRRIRRQAAKIAAEQEATGSLIMDKTKNELNEIKDRFDSEQ